VTQNIFSVRTASPSDIDFIMKVEAASFIKPIQEERSVFLKRLGVCPHLFLILERKGLPAGYLSAEILKSIPQNVEELKLGHEPSEVRGLSPLDFVYISSFAILPEFRGNSSGKTFWNLSLEYFEKLGYKKFLLLVNEEWKGAAHIYEESGFRQVTVFENFFPTEKENLTDGILMKK